MNSNGDVSISHLADELGEEFADYIAEKVADEMSPSLNSMSPREAVDKYFESRDLTPGTKNTHRSSLYNFFLKWCEEIA